MSPERPTLPPQREPERPWVYWMVFTMMVLSGAVMGLTGATG